MSEKEKTLTASPGKKTPMEILRDRYSAAESQRVHFAALADKLRREIYAMEWKEKGIEIGTTVDHYGKRAVVGKLDKWSMYGYFLKQDGTPGAQLRYISTPYTIISPPSRTPDMENPA